MADTSSDEGGDTIKYAWLKDGVTTPVMTGTVTAVTSGEDYGFPRCDAMFVNGQGVAGGDIYLAVT